MRDRAGSPQPMENVIFLRSAALANYGSAYLRADQLCQIANECTTSKAAGARVLTHADDLRDSLVVLNKTFLIENGADAIATIRASGNVIASDFVDLPIARDICEVSDILVSSSLTQHDFLRTNYANKPTVHIPHHADLRICAAIDRNMAVNVGYFGAIYNGLYLEELTREGLCDVIPATTANDTQWMMKLPCYRCHYAVRAQQSFDGFKPFIKGAVAARIGAVILTTRDEETVRNLGDDYPFFVPPSLEAIRQKILMLREGARDEDWRTAMLAMANLRDHCSRERVSLAIADLVECAKAI